MGGTSIANDHALVEAETRKMTMTSETAALMAVYGVDVEAGVHVVLRATARIAVSMIPTIAVATTTATARVAMTTDPVIVGTTGLCAMIAALIVT